MSDFITLSCPSCGAKLEITQDINRFACSYCGQEHIVKRSGGIVSLSPVVDAINEVKTGVDKTAAELAMARLPKEIAALLAEKSNLLKTSPYPKEYSMEKLIASLIIGSLLLLVPLIVTISGNNIGPCAFAVWGGPGIVLIIYGIRPIITHNTKRLKEKEAWEVSTGVRIKSINEQIALKQSELEHNRKLVSQ